MLKVTSDGRRAALDLRLVGQRQIVPGKLAVAADRIAAIWQAHRDDEYLTPGGTPYPVRGSLQLVFSDLGTPGPGWNAYDELRAQLTARGLPRDAIRFVHEAKNDTDLARLFAACRSGHVAVLLGSTEKLGVGTNVQDRAVALHHLDAPWRPADVDQREGRIIRQGNLNQEAQVIRYLAARSFDGYSWQTLERKARFIHDIMSPTLDARDIGDIGDTVLSYSEAKALATGNPLLMDKAQADADLARLVRAERAHHRTQDTLRRTITRLEKHIAAHTRPADDIDTAITRRQDTRGDAFTMTVDGRTYTRRADAGRHLLDRTKQEAANQLGYRHRTIRAGELGGFTLTLTIAQTLGQVTVTPALEGAPGTEITLTPADLAEMNPAGLVTRLENRLTRLEATKTKVLADIDHARSEIDHATASLGTPFPQTTDLAAARERTRQIDQQLEAAATPALPQDAEAGHDGATVPARQDSSVTAHNFGSPDTSRTANIAANHQQADDIRGMAASQWPGATVPGWTADPHRHRGPTADPTPEGRSEPGAPRWSETEPDIRPPWPSATERQPWPAIGRTSGPDAPATHDLDRHRPGPPLPQQRDAEQRHRATHGNDRHAYEREAGQ
jgi:hypothetical protein